MSTQNPPSLLYAPHAQYKHASLSHMFRSTSMKLLQLLGELQVFNDTFQGINNTMALVPPLHCTSRGNVTRHRVRTQP